MTNDNPRNKLDAHLEITGQPLLPKSKLPSISEVPSTSEVPSRIQHSDLVVILTDYADVSVFKGYVGTVVDTPNIDVPILALKIVDFYSGKVRIIENLYVLLNLYTIHLTMMEWGYFI